MKETLNIFRQSIYKLTFILFFYFFILDSIINRISHLPLALAAVTISVIVLYLYRPNRNTVFVALVLTLLLVKSPFYSFNALDFGYYVNFLAILYFLHGNSTHIAHSSNWLTPKLLVSIFSVVCLLYWSYLLGTDNPVHEADLNAIGANPEYYRSYHSGLFRAPHFPSYLFYFLSLAVYFYRNKIGKHYFVIIFIGFLGILSSGSRTPIFAFLLGLFLVHFRKNIKNIYIISSIVLLVLILFYFRLPILKLTSGTTLYQYFSIFDTIANNFDRLSRVQLAIAFYDGISNFSALQHLFGSSFSSQMAVTYSLIGQKLWFHNDFLAIYFSYGILGLIIYSWGLFRLYQYIIKKTNSKIIILFYFSLILFSAFNGIIYHPTIIYMFLLFNMLYEEQYQKSEVNCY